MAAIAANVQYLVDLAWDFQSAQRIGAEEDQPEGARYITLSHTLAMKIARNLERIAEDINPEPGRLVPSRVAQELIAMHEEELQGRRGG